MSIFLDQVRSEFTQYQRPDPISIVEFAEGLCNKPLYPRQRALLKIIFLEELTGYEEDVLSEWIRGGQDGNVSISPYIRERIEACRADGRPHFSTTMFVAGRRSSKGHLTGFAGGKKVFEARRLGDPGKYYGIDRDKEITFAAVSAKFDQAKDTQFQDLFNTIMACPELFDNIGKALEESISVRTPSDVKALEARARQNSTFSKDIALLNVMPFASNANTLRGRSMLFCVLDEFAFFQTGESAASADEILKAVRPSLSQFRKDALLMMNSSPYTKDSRFFKEFMHLMAAENGKPFDPTGFAIKFPSWELYRDKERDRKFANAIMVSPDWDPATLTDEERLQQEKERIEEQGDPEAYKVEKRAEWAEVLDGYLNPDVVDRAFREFVPELGIRIKAQNGGRADHQPYMAAIDASSTTAGFGFSVGHAEIFPNAGRAEGFAKHVIFDFVKKWDPQTFPGKTIDYPVVIDDIVRYCVIFRPTVLQMDQFGSGPVSGYLKQQLRNAGVYETEVKIEAGAQHRNWDKWEAYKTALNHGFIHFPLDCDSATGELGGDSAQLMKELKQLQVKRTGQVPKVDKPPSSGAFKDISDTTRDVSWLLIGEQMMRFASPEQLAAPLSMGSPGGFQIGGRNPGGPMQGVSNNGMGSGTAPGQNQAMNEWYAQRSGGYQGGPSRGFGGGRGGRR